MIFPTETLRALRESLGAQMEAGTLAPQDAFRQALATDPDDFTSITHLIDDAMTAGRFADAERLGWELLRTAPTSPHSYLMFTTVLERSRPESKLPMQFMKLGLELMRYDAAALHDFEFDQLLSDDMLGMIEGLEKPDALEAVLHGLELLAAESTPPEVVPYRRILTLRAAGSGPVERAEVDAILADPKQYAPLLRGVLKQYAEGELDGDVTLVERALTLLGEMGDMSLIPDLSGFFPDDELVTPAMWAFSRIAARGPQEAIEEVRRSLEDAEPLGLFAAAQFLAHMPRTDGQLEVLASVLDGIEDVPRAHRAGIVWTVLTGLYILDGADNQRAVRLERRYGKMLTKKALKQLQDIREVRRKTGPEPPPAYSTTIYDICCTGTKAWETDADSETEGDDECP
jgi:hypothetical protein